MRFPKAAVIAIGVIAILAAGAWYLRNTLIQEISNPLLREFGVNVTDVSLDAVATRDASISYLELTHDNGTRIRIEKLILPLRSSATGQKTYKARKVSVITSSETNDEPLALAQLIGEFVARPESLGNSEFVVAEIDMPPLPTLHDVRWTVAKSEQTVSATVQSIGISVALVQNDSGGHSVSLTLPDISPQPSNHSIAATLQSNVEAMTLIGASTLDLVAWEPLARLLSIVPDGIQFKSGTAELQFAVEVPFDEQQVASITAELKPSSSTQLVYSEIPDEFTTIALSAGEPIHLAATFPELTWTLQQAKAAVLVSQDHWVAIPVSISDLACTPGPVCSMRTNSKMTNIKLPFGSVEKLLFASSQELVFLDEGLQIAVRPNATLELSGVVTPAATIGKLSAQLTSNASVELTDAGWRLLADSVDASVSGLSPADDMSFVAPLFFEQVQISDLDDVMSASAGVYVPSSQLIAGAQTIELPGYKGQVVQQDAALKINLQTIGLQKNGDIRIRHDLETGIGELHLSDSAISFEKRKLSRRIAPWDEIWDIAGGTLSASLQASWTESDTSGNLAARIENVSGHYDDIAFVGLATSLEGTYTDDSGFTPQPSHIALATVDVGLPLDNISADYTLHPDLLAVDVANLKMGAFDGVIRADPFSFHTGRSRNTLLLYGESIELDALLTLKEFEAIEVSGSIAARIPVTIEDGTVTIVNGTLTGDPPGGVIRYLPGLAVADTTSIGLASRALSNFRYETLTAEVEYSMDGDLNLQLHLFGRNPDLDQKRPVVLNLGVENNVPQMLKSLQAARTVEEILEKRLKK